MGAFAAWLMGFAKSFIIWLLNGGVDLINASISGFVSFVLGIIGMFPSGSNMPSLPTIPSGSSWVAFINAINWFFPLDFLVQILTFSSTAMLAYLAIAPLARWIKLLT